MRPPPSSVAVRALPSAASGSPKLTPCTFSRAEHVASTSAVTTSRYWTSIAFSFLDARASGAGGSCLPGALGELYAHRTNAGASSARTERSFGAVIAFVSPRKLGSGSRVSISMRRRRAGRRRKQAGQPPLPVLLLSCGRAGARTVEERLQRRHAHAHAVHRAREHDAGGRRVDDDHHALALRHVVDRLYLAGDGYRSVRFGAHGLTDARRRR